MLLGPKPISGVHFALLLLCHSFVTLSAPSPSLLPSTVAAGYHPATMASRLLKSACVRIQKGASYSKRAENCRNVREFITQQKVINTSLKELAKEQARSIKDFLEKPITFSESPISLRVHMVNTNPTKKHLMDLAALLLKNMIIFYAAYRIGIKKLTG
jgi:hypothetical protein